MLCETASTDIYSSLLFYDWFSIKFHTKNTMYGLLLFITYSYVTPNTNWSIDRQSQVVATENKVENSTIIIDRFKHK